MGWGKMSLRLEVKEEVSSGWGARKNTPAAASSSRQDSTEEKPRVEVNGERSSPFPQLPKLAPPPVCSVVPTTPATFTTLVRRNRVTQALEPIPCPVIWYTEVRAAISRPSTALTISCTHSIAAEYDMAMTGIAPPTV
jgi:hypothetical protein